MLNREIMPTNRYEENWQNACANAEGLEIVEHGWEQHVMIDQQQGLVYRYPRHNAAAAKLDDEVSVLGEVNKQIWPVRLPVIREHTPRYTAYDYIPGDVLTPDTVSNLSVRDLEHIGKDLGTFLAQFHQLDPSVVENKNTKQTTTLLEYYAERINNAANTPYYTKAKQSLEALENSENHTREVVVHGDLHGPNIVIDPKTKKLRGVIDLSEMEIGDPHHEFRKIFMSYPDALPAAVDSYEENGGQQLNPERIILWAYTNEWANACHFAGDPHNATFQRAIAHLENWQQL